MVVLGAIFIWIGLSSGGGSGAGSSADGSVAAAEGAAEDAGPAQLERPRPDVPAERTLDFDPVPAADLAVGKDQPAPDVVPSAPAEAQPEVPARVAEAPAPRAEPRVDPPAAVAPARMERPAPGARDVQITGGAAARNGRLARLVLESWVRRDGADLETFLTVGEGTDMPADEVQMIVGFWEALVGNVDAARGRLDAVRDSEHVTSTQLGLLSAALDPPGARAIPAPASARTRVEPLGHAMRMVLLEDEARALLAAREYARSAVSYSDLIQMEVGAPWAPHRDALLEWGGKLEKAQANHRWNPRGRWPFVEEKVRDGDAGLTAIRKRVLKRRPDLQICTGLIGRANGVRKYIRGGDVLRVPTDDVNVIVDLDARVLMYRHGDEVVQLWQVGIGRPKHETPLGEFTIGIKQEKPAHTTKGLPYGHPDNELGSRWLALERNRRNTSYGIHGTQDPDGVGGEVSLGCIRMRNEDVNELFEILPRGARVLIQE